MRWAGVAAEGSGPVTSALDFSRDRHTAVLSLDAQEAAD